MGLSRRAFVKARRLISRSELVNKGGRGLVNVIDVGSVGGLPDFWRDHASFIRHLLRFEPLEKERRRGTVRTIPAALWRANETRPFYIQRGSSTGNSLYPPNIEWVAEHFEELKARGGSSEMADTWAERSAIAKTEMIDVQTLDSVLEAVGEGVRYDFLKIDTQGADHDVLLGAERLLAEDCIGIQLEAFLIPLYKGITLLDQIDAHLVERGFLKVRTTPPDGTFLCFQDLVYLKQGASGPAADAIKRVYDIY